MKFPTDLIPGRLIQRYKRFLADVELADGTIVTAHCANSGSMLGCKEPGSKVLLSLSPNPNRKLAHTWEMVDVNGYWAGINTALPNRLAREGIENGTVVELQGYSGIRNEVPYGTNSRVDLLLEFGTRRCYLEVKNVTMVAGQQAFFPDAVTVRGQKHLRELQMVVAAGDRGVILFVVQRGDAASVSPADAIDPVYGRLLRAAVANGVEALAYQATVTPTEIYLTHRLPIILP